MFKIARTVRQIFNVARNIPKSASASVNNIFKYSNGSKGYVEDARDEFSFLKALPSQSDKASLQETFNIFNPNLANITKAKITQSLDSAETRKLIYARFADEIAAKPKNVVDTRSHEMKEYVGDVVAKYNIADEFKALKSQGYDFAGTRKAIENQNINKTLSERMKELVVSGHISRYSGEAGLKEEVEELMDKHVLVIKEFMKKVQDRAGFVSVDNTVLLVDSENDAAMSDDLTKADLLGEY